MTRRSQVGFTLLEAIVAITIFATSAMGIYAWINSMLIGSARMDTIAVETADANSAIDFLKMVNPMETPSGRRQLGELELQWDSELVEPVRPGNMVGAWEFGLYDMRVQLVRPGVHERQITLRQVGYRKLSLGDGGMGI